jgi:hypothetical protein
MQVIDDSYLHLLECLLPNVSPGPWYPRCGDDSYCMSATWVSLDEGPGFINKGFIDDHPSNRCVAITLLQQPRLADVDGNFDANTMFICEAREAVPAMIAEIRKLREELDSAKAKISSLELQNNT